jgi:hypothetical protein
MFCKHVPLHFYKSQNQSFSNGHMFANLDFLRSRPKAKVDVCVKTRLIIHPTLKTKIPKLFFTLLILNSHIRTPILCNQENNE